jgi:predicted ester cyclase
VSTVQTIHRELAERWNARDYEGLRNLMHPDYTYTASDGTESAGPEAGLGVAKTYGEAFPDARMELQRLYTEDQTAIAELSVEGTHTGPLREVAPTGKRVRSVLCNIVELREGKIYRERDYFDPLSLLRQIGAVPAPPVPAEQMP